MNGWIIILALIVGWLILSQWIAWFVTPSEQEDEVLENWFVIFLTPPCLLIVAVEIMDERFRRFARKLGVWWL